jgi:hypothetical protein
MIQKTMAKAVPVEAKEPKRTPRVPRASPRVAGGSSMADAALPAPRAQELLEGPTREALIRQRAYDIYERNGCVAGREVDDWLSAEMEIDRLVTEGTVPLAATSGAG